MARKPTRLSGDIPIHAQVQHRGLLMIAVMGASIMQILDTTIANVAIPHMQSSLGATSESVNWVLTSYIVATAVAMPLTGWLADRIGRRQLFLISVCGFILASMACGAAQSLEQMVLFRIFQGLFAAFIGPLSQSVMLDIHPPEQHSRAMSIWGMGIMVGPILGPFLGGWLTEAVNWRWVFYVNVPVGILTLFMLWLLLPDRAATPRRFDLFGFSILALGLAALQLLLDRGAHEDWFSSVEIWIEAGLALACLWIFLVHMFTAREPLFPKSMLRDRNMITALGFMIILGLAMFAPMALLPPMLQKLFGWPIIDTGMVLATRGIGILLSMALAGRLVGRVDARWLVGTGFAIGAFSMWMMSHWTLDMGMSPVVISGLVQGLGMGLVFIPLNSLAFATIPPQYRTDASSLLNLFRSLGASFGISIVVTMLASSGQRSHEELGGHITNSAVSMLDASTLDRFGQLGDGALAMVNAEITRQATMIAYLNDFWFIMWAMLAVVPMALFLRPPAKNAAKVDMADMGH
ncbi:MDR family MFS transporter [Sphingopyxis yananensis]|uniref:MDR family MFS transporter n=1 Tax=Sphingopyxis yananensis TaxID=2886687 RepID=UPI001D10C03A|nr:MDR family MFS transporter [Sphingopyxis yananensis]MCC2602885.1 multidrug efflux MFS transporter [Sphingopyxis yananensis]